MIIKNFPVFASPLRNTENLIPKENMLNQIQSNTQTIKIL